MGYPFGLRVACRVENLMPHEDPFVVAGQNVIQAAVNTLLIQEFRTVRVARRKDGIDDFAARMGIQSVKANAIVQVGRFSGREVDDVVDDENAAAHRPDGFQLPSRDNQPLGRAGEETPYQRSVGGSQRMDRTIPAPAQDQSLVNGGR